MNWSSNGKSNDEPVNTGGTGMDNTNEYVQKLHDKQRKDEQNRKRQGKENPSDKLPNKQH
jgi:hypothetical protein